MSGKWKEREWVSLVVWFGILIFQKLTGIEVLPSDSQAIIAQGLGLGGFAVSRGLAKRPA